MEAELAKSEEGQARLDKSKDRIDHWAAKIGEDALVDESVEKDSEQERTTGVFNEDAETKQAEEFDISGSPAKEPEEEIKLSSRSCAIGKADWNS